MNHTIPSADERHEPLERPHPCIGSDDINQVLPLEAELESLRQSNEQLREARDSLYAELSATLAAYDQVRKLIYSMQANASKCDHQFTECNTELTSLQPLLHGSFAGALRYVLSYHGKSFAHAHQKAARPLVRTLRRLQAVRHQQIAV